ncbi:bifunctional purple acid phosphatase 26-like protein, partial [Tanacetum coccineum]
IPLDNEVFAVPSGYNAPQQVHITQGDYDGKAVIIMWVTPDEPGSNQVRYGTSEKKYDFTAQGSPVKNYTFYNYKSGYLHQCLVDDLKVFVYLNSLSNVYYQFITNTCVSFDSMIPSTIMRLGKVILLDHFGFRHHQKSIQMLLTNLEL